MGRLLGVRTKDEVTFFKLKSASRNLTSVKRRLFYTGDDRMLKCKHKGEAMILYDLESTQPYGKKEYLDPDMTKLFIDSAKTHNGVGVNRFGFFSNIDSKYFPFILVGVFFVAQMVI